jgi:hypothetical protein
MVLDLLGEAIGQASEAANGRPHRQFCRSAKLVEMWSGSGSPRTIFVSDLTRLRRPLSGTHSCRFDAGLNPIA